MLWSESGVTAVARWTWSLGASHVDSETVVARWTMSLGAGQLSIWIREIFLEFKKTFWLVRHNI